ncbi:DNA-binding SARP family transcriptional activator [Prauserella shujinwangii]|uniref:DNA-binding SARP family transcriptional activator n=1 Tax=Prauserella shujinwangii TaxID=1453103 RepID=A0A2T0M2I5_9PSEU|nr:BTAD domain-containing putative transcriptional regulator [Prauserella shujinwangii]PRX50936.1 DNA-binding SARP family transcriptional activator [Prauserella shujinwangii]
MSGRSSRGHAPGPVRPRFLVLGPVAVALGDGHRAPAPRDQVVLAALLAHRNTVVPASRLAGWAWPERDAPSRNALQARISRLRGLLGPGRAAGLEFRSGGYRLRVPAGEADDDLLRDAVDRARWLLGADQPVAAGEVLTAGLELWRGEPYAPHGQAPFAATAVAALRELHRTARLLRCAAAREAGDLDGAVAAGRLLVEEDPLWPGGRAELMRALDAAGRRAEALDVYEAGRRLVAEATGLEPATELRSLQQRILREERSRARTRLAGPGVLDPLGMLRWLAEAGDVEPALRLGVRCAWGWWLTGDRARGRSLIHELLVRYRNGGCSDRTLDLRARAWAGALSVHDRDQHRALRDARDALAALGTSWAGTDALAAVLVAERHHERGERAAARELLGGAVRSLRAADDVWGLALAELVEARGLLLSGSCDAADRAATAALSRFERLADPAGQLAALDVLGYSSEVHGRYRAAARHHLRALEYAVHGDWPHARGRQLARLGSVLGLAGDPEAGRARLTEALALGRELGSHQLAAYALNGLAVVDVRTGTPARARHRHREALGWYRDTGSGSGVAFTAAALSRVVGDAAERRSLQREALRAALGTGDPRSVAYALESAAVTARTPLDVATLTGAARELRRRTGRELPPGEQPDLARAAGRAAAAAGADFERHAGAAAGTVARGDDAAVYALAATVLAPAG